MLIILRQCQRNTLNHKYNGPCLYQNLKSKLKSNKIGKLISTHELEYRKKKPKNKKKPGFY